MCGRRLLVLLLLGLWYVTPAYSQVCPFGTEPCQGRYGTGCYNPAYAACHNGLVCASAFAPCLGRFGAGCYNPASAACYDGLVCPTPLQPCIGRHGAQCYDPSTASCAASPLPPFRPRHR
jgi:hypothetical protein